MSSKPLRALFCHPLTLTLAACAAPMLILQWLPQSLATFAFHPASLADQPWRILSAHWVHLNGEHLLYNLLGFAFACLLFAPVLTPWRLLSAILLSALAGSWLSWWFAPNVSFVGFSGVLHGLVAFASVLYIQRRVIWGPLMLTLLLAKLVVEIGWAPDALNWLGVATAHWVHTGGALGGLLAALLCIRLQKTR